MAGPFGIRRAQLTSVIPQGEPDRVIPQGARISVIPQGAALSGPALAARVAGFLVAMAPCLSRAPWLVSERCDGSVSRGGGPRWAVDPRSRRAGFVAPGPAPAAESFTGTTPSHRERRCTQISNCLMRRRCRPRAGLGAPSPTPAAPNAFLFWNGPGTLPGCEEARSRTERSVSHPRCIGVHLRSPRQGVVPLNDSVSGAPHDTERCRAGDQPRAPRQQVPTALRAAG